MAPARLAVVTGANRHRARDRSPAGRARPARRGDEPRRARGLGELSGLAAPLRRRSEARELGRAELRDLVESFVRDVAEGTHATGGFFRDERFVPW